MKKLMNYPDKSPVPAELPDSYRLATTPHRCGNCQSFMPLSNRCRRFHNAIVRTAYVCDAWLPRT